MNENALFVTGTDTGVGKTVVTALIALRLRQMGVNCGVLKPFASGCFWREGELISEDAEFLREALDLKDSLDEICPIRLEEPLTPLIAARRKGISTENWLEIARDAFEDLGRKYEMVIVEGVGGLLAPIWERQGVISSNLELINTWGLPTVVVARRGLGTINHTLMTLNCPPNPPARFAGIIWNDAAPINEADVAIQTSPGYVESITAVPGWGSVPFGNNFERSTLEEMTARLKIQGID